MNFKTRRLRLTFCHKTLQKTHSVWDKWMTEHTQILLSLRSSVRISIRLFVLYETCASVSCSCLPLPFVSSPGTCGRKHCGRATPAGCAPPSSTTTTCSHSASWWWCWPSCFTSYACAGSTSESSGRPRSWTSSGLRREKPSFPERYVCDGALHTDIPQGLLSSMTCSAFWNQSTIQKLSNVSMEGKYTTWNSLTSRGCDFAYEDIWEDPYILLWGKTSQYRDTLMSLEIKQLCTFFDRAALNTEPISGWKDLLCVYLLLCKTILEKRNQLGRVRTSDPKPCFSFV